MRCVACYAALFMSSTIFFALPNTSIVLSTYNTSLARPSWAAAVDRLFKIGVRAFYASRIGMNLWV